MSEKMIERVAKAIYEAMDIADSLAMPEAETYARAAIEAMRDSLTPEFATMVMSCNEIAYIDWTREQHDREEWYGDYNDFAVGWKAAFDAALT